MNAMEAQTWLALHPDAVLATSRAPRLPLSVASWIRSADPAKLNPEQTAMRAVLDAAEVSHEAG